MLALTWGTYSVELLGRLKISYFLHQVKVQWKPWSLYVKDMLMRITWNIICSFMCITLVVFFLELIHHYVYVSVRDMGIKINNALGILFMVYLRPF